jgi:hypothetical protein
LSGCTWAGMCGWATPASGWCGQRSHLSIPPDCDNVCNVANLLQDAGDRYNHSARWVDGGRDEGCYHRRRPVGLQRRVYREHAVRAVASRARGGAERSTPTQQKNPSHVLASRSGQTRAPDLLHISARLSPFCKVGTFLQGWHLSAKLYAAVLVLLWWLTHTCAGGWVARWAWAGVAYVICAWAIHRLQVRCRSHCQQQRGRVLHHPRVLRRREWVAARDRPGAWTLCRHLPGRGGSGSRR